MTSALNDNNDNTGILEIHHTLAVLLKSVLVETARILDKVLPEVVVVT